MFTLEWRLTLISISILPLFMLAASKLGNRMRDITRTQMDLNAKMNAVILELLNISGALLVKLFGRHAEEDERFKKRGFCCAQYTGYSGQLPVPCFLSASGC